MLGRAGMGAVLFLRLVRRVPQRGQLVEPREFAATRRWMMRLAGLAIVATARRKSSRDGNDGGSVFGARTRESHHPTTSRRQRRQVQ
jgi:hypothetical protein